MRPRTASILRESAAVETQAYHAAAWDHLDHPAYHSGLMISRLAWTSRADFHYERKFGECIALSQATTDQALWLVHARD